MPRAPDERAIEAEKLYRDGMPMVEIANKLGVSDGTVRSWKNRYSWGNGPKKNKCNVAKKNTKKNATLQTKKRGAPKGNTNAKGHKNPPTNKPPDRTKHGGYSAVYWDTLRDDEKELIEEIPIDEETLLVEQIQLFSVRERRIMQAINKYRDTKEPVAINSTSRSESKRSLSNDEDKKIYEERQRMKIVKGEILPGNLYNVSTFTENKDNIITRLESELSNVQAKKTKAIEALTKLNLVKHRIEYDTRKLELELIKTEGLLNKDGLSDDNSNMPETNFVEALNAEAAGVWEDE